MAEKSCCVVGKNVPRIDSKVKVTGSAKFTADLKLPNMLYAKIIRSTVPHAKVAKIDKYEAENFPGVRAIITYEDVPSKKFCSYWRETKDIERLRADENILNGTVRFVGDRIAALAAESEEIAENAVDLIKIDYEKLPAVFDPEEAMKPDAPAIHEGVERNIVAHISMERGDVEKGFKDADYIFEDTYKLPIQHHCPMEPHACLAYFNNFTGKLTVWSTNQGVFNLRWLLAYIFDLSLNKVRVIQPFIGGGFGGKNPVLDEPVVAFLSIKTGRPVLLAYSRQEELACGRRRHSTVIKLKVGVKKDGVITAKQMTAVLDKGAYCDAGPKVANTLGHRWLMLYPVPHMKYDGYVVYTNKSPATSMRGFGTPQQSFAWESMLDDIAEKLGIDPLELRLKNLVQKGNVDPYSGQIIESCGIQECIKKAAKEIGWDRRKNLAIHTGTKRRGIGMACGTHNTGVWPYVFETTGALVVINEDGTVNLTTGIVDIGQGSNTVFAQICAEVLGISLENVNVVQLDTEIAPYDIGTHSSRCTHIGGNAVKAAAEDAKRQILEVAAKILKVNKDELEIDNGKVFAKSNPKMAVTIGEVASKAVHGEDPHQIIGIATYHPSSMAPPFLAQFAEVEVDVETGQVKVLKVVAAHDVGKAINPNLLEGQIEGGVAMGLEYALTGGLQFDQKTGRYLNATLTDYKLPCFSDMPEIKVITVESFEPTGPYGAKGVGEPAMVGIGPAIANAVYNALGFRIKELPITPDKVLEACTLLKLVEG